MEELFTTKGKNEELKAIYEDNKFKVVFVYPDGSRYEADETTEVSNLVESYNFWGMLTGLFNTPIESRQVEKHLTASSLRVGEKDVIKND